MGQTLSDYRTFLREFRRTYESTGAIMPSGRRLAAALTSHVRPASVDNVTASRRILEVGPGTGAVTGHIIASMGTADHLTLVELNDRFVECLRRRLDSNPQFQQVRDRVTIVHASVEDVPADATYDCMISGLPLNNFPVDLVERILTKLMQLLSAGGTLSFFEYIAIRRAKALVSGTEERSRLTAISALLEDLLRKHEFQRDRIWQNVPPAYVHHVRSS